MTRRELLATVQTIKHFRPYLYRREFRLRTDHAGVKHGNTEGLSRQTCEDCQQCDLIERRDDGPTRQELDQSIEDRTSLAFKTPVEVDNTGEDRLCSTANDFKTLWKQFQREGRLGHTLCVLQREA